MGFRKVFSVLFLAVALLICILSRVMTLDVDALNVDEASYAAAAVRALDTGAPYMKNSRDNKPPGVYAIYGTVFKAFGNYNMRALRWTALAWVLLTAAVIFMAGRRAGGTVFAGFAAGFYLIAVNLDIRFIAFKTEIMMSLPVAVAMLCLFEAQVRARGAWPWLLLGGVASGMAVTIRQPSALIIAGIVAGMAWHGLRSGGRAAVARVASMLALLAAGAAMFLGAVALYYRQAGALPEMLYQTFQLPYEYSLHNAYGLGIRVVRLVTFLEEYFRYNQVLFGVGLVGWALAVYRLLRPKAGGENGHDFLGPVVVFGVPAAIAAFAAAPGGYQAYFIQLFIPFSLAFALALREAVAAAARNPALRFPLGVASILTVASALVLCTKEPFKIMAAGSRYGEGGIESVLAAMRPDIRPGDRLFVWGFKPNLYLASKMPPATRFTVTDTAVGVTGEVGRTLDPGQAHPYYEPRGWDVLMAELEAEKPKFIIDGVYMANVEGSFSLRTYPRLARYVDAHYSVVPTQQPPFTLYRRKADAAAAQPAP